MMLVHCSYDIDVVVVLPTVTVVDFVVVAIADVVTVAVNCVVDSVIVISALLLLLFLPK